MAVRAIGRRVLSRQRLRRHLVVCPRGRWNRERHHDTEEQARRGSRPMRLLGPCRQSRNHRALPRVCFSSCPFVGFGAVQVQGASRCDIRELAPMAAAVSPKQTKRAQLKSGARFPGPPPVAPRSASQCRHQWCGLHGSQSRPADTAIGKWCRRSRRSQQARPEAGFSDWRGLFGHYERADNSEAATPISRSTACRSGPGPRRLVHGK